MLGEAEAPRVGPQEEGVRDLWALVAVRRPSLCCHSLSLMVSVNVSLQ